MDNVKLLKAIYNTNSNRILTYKASTALGKVTMPGFSKIPVNQPWH